MHIFSRAKQRWAFIPVRIGSERLLRKNLKLLAGQPMLTYATTSAIASGLFDRVVVNGDDLAFKEHAIGCGAEFFLREKNLGCSEIRSDEVIYDFITSNSMKNGSLTWVNSVSPLLKPNDLVKAHEYFDEKKLDSLITTNKRQVHALYDGAPLNFSYKEPFAKTQELEPVETFNYSIMIWNVDVFVREYELNGHALFCGNFDTYSLPFHSSLHVKTQEDFALIEKLLKS